MRLPELTYPRRNHRRRSSHPLGWRSPLRAAGENRADGGAPRTQSPIERAEPCRTQLPEPGLPRSLHRPEPGTGRPSERGKGIDPAPPHAERPQPGSLPDVPVSCPAADICRASPSRTRVRDIRIANLRSVRNRSRYKRTSFQSCPLRAKDRFTKANDNTRPGHESRTKRRNCLKNMVGSRRLELPTSSVSRKRSNQLSYEPTKGGKSQYNNLISILWQNRIPRSSRAWPAHR